MITKKRLFISFLLVASFSFVSFAQTGPENGLVPGHGDVPVPVVKPGRPVIPANIVWFSSYLSGEVSFYDNTVEIRFSQPVCISSITLTNMSDGRSRYTNFYDVMTDQVIVPSLSSNGLWDICVRSGYTEYHAVIFVDCYQSFHICPED